MSELDDEKITFEFLPDDPVQADGFAGKGHERSARALANAIVNFSDDDRSIGLEGSWGSGKTTVVRMAEKNLGSSQPEKFSFFTFDLWANQSVEFRRAFLEEFLDWSDPFLSKALSGKKREDLEKRVRGKTKVVETENERQYSIFGYTLMSTLFLLPFLILWLSPFSANLHINRAKPLEAGTTQTDLPQLFQFLLDYGHNAAAALVLIVAFGFIIQTAYLWRTKNSIRKALDSSFSLFARKSDKDTVTQTIRDGDPTQYEFHEIFTEILSIAQKNGHRVVFVFDNLDRLPATAIQKMWSDVRSVFSPNIDLIKSPNTAVTAVVPYDRSHVLVAFKESLPAHNEPTSEELGAPRPTYEMEDVFRKTFSAVVSVAPPVASDVEAFLGQCLENALPNQFDTGQKYRLFQIFDIFLTEMVSNPTPRQVKSFVNDIGMLWLQWQGEISIEAIAIFVLHRTKLEADPKSLQKPETIQARYKHFTIKPDLDSELAALAYNVEPETALEVLLGRDIISALRSKNSERLLALSGSPGFKTQLDDILAQHCSDWASTSLYDFETALDNYSKLTLEPSVKELCNKHFADAASNFDDWTIVSWKDHKSLFKIVSCIPKASMTMQMKRIAEWVKKNLPEELTVSHGRAWINFIGGFIEEIRELYGIELVRMVTGAINIPYSPTFYVGVALDCDNVNLHFSSFQSVAKNNSVELSTATASFGIDNAEDFFYVWNELGFALKTPEKIAVFSKLIEKTQAELLDDDLRRVYLENLVLISASTGNDASISEKIQAALVDGSLSWHASKFNELEDWLSIANAVWLAHIVVGTGPIPGLSAPDKPPFGDMSPAHTWFGKCYAGAMPEKSLEITADLVIKHDKVDHWVSAFAKSPEHVMYKKVLIEVFAAEECPAVELETLIGCYDALKEHFGDEALETVVRLVGTETPSEQTDQLEITMIPPSLVRDIADRQEPTWLSILGRIDNHLKAITSVGWEEALVTDNQDRKLLFARGTKMSGVIPPSHLRTPLVDFVSSVMISKEAPTDDLDNHEIFWSVLSPSIGNGVSKDVFERIFDKPVVFEGLGFAMSVFPGLFAVMPLKDNPDTAVSKIFITLLAKSPERALAFVHTKSSEWASCVKKVSLDVRKQLNEYFGDYEDSEEHQPQIDELRKLLKLSKPKRKPKPEDADHEK